MISLVESFLCTDKQATHKKDRRIQWPKRSEKNKDEDNSPKTPTDNSQVFIVLQVTDICLSSEIPVWTPFNFSAGFELFVSIF